MSINVLTVDTIYYFNHSFNIALIFYTLNPPRNGKFGANLCDLLTACAREQSDWSCPYIPHFFVI